MEYSQMIKKANTDEWYTTENNVRLILPWLEKTDYKKILCPFDTKESNFVKVLQRGGYQVTYGHIKTGQDFFDQDLSKFDAVISNPPFSIRDDIFARLYEYNIPFALIMNLNGIFDSKKRYNIFKQNNFEILVPRGRMKFFNDNNMGMNSPNFQSVYICNGFLPRQIIFSGSVEEDCRQMSLF